MSALATHDVDADWLQAVLLDLLRTPTGVPAGATEVEPGDAGILAAIDRVILPHIESLEPDEIRRHPLGDVAARFGPPGDRGLLVQTYVVSQHGNLMADPLDGRIVDGAAHGIAGPCAVGQGANQNKGPLAAVLAALRESSRDLDQPVWLALNTEGKSSHGGSRRILDDLDVTARWGIVSIGTDLRVSIGNRGRVDVSVTVPGASCHSSQPWLGSNPIEGASEVVQALRSAPLPPPHPDLGPASATPYQLACHPVAPHTIPAEARIVVDRRMLPGEDPAAVADELRAYLDLTVEGELKVDKGEWMLPASVSADSPLVSTLYRHLGDITGEDPELIWSKNTFDAGYACSRGIPTCMFGPGRRSFSAGVTAAELVAIHDCVVAAAALRRTFADLCSTTDNPTRRRR